MGSDVGRIGHPSSGFPAVKISCQNLSSPKLWGSPSVQSIWAERNKSQVHCHLGKIC